MLFQKGDPPKGFYFVVYGQIKLAFPSARATRRWSRSSDRARASARR